jgi:hypothetical protein
MLSTLDSIATGSAVGALLPPLTAVVQQPKWSAGIKRIVAVFAALFGGVVTVVSTGGVAQFEHPVPALGAIVAVIVASQTTYDLIWKPSKIAPAVEDATSATARTTE